MKQLLTAAAVADGDAALMKLYAEYLDVLIVRVQEAQSLVERGEWESAELAVAYMLDPVGDE